MYLMMIALCDMYKSLDKLYNINDRCEIITSHLHD